MPNAQVALGAYGYADDLVLTNTGDLLVLVDTPNNPAASEQLLLRIVLTCPIILDTNGNPIARADDMFNRNFGAGITRLLGAPLTPALQSQIQNQIVASIAASAAFAATPSPTVSAYTVGLGSNQLYVAVAATTVIGYRVIQSSIPVQIYALAS